MTCILLNVSFPYHVYFYFDNNNTSGSVISNQICNDLSLPSTILSVFLVLAYILEIILFFSTAFVIDDVDKH
jgi:hypothetical protein